MKNTTHKGVIAIPKEQGDIISGPIGPIHLSVSLDEHSITMVQVRSLGMAEVANGGHITVRSEPCWTVLNLLYFR